MTRPSEQIAAYQAVSTSASDTGDNPKNSAPNEKGVSARARASWHHLKAWRWEIFTFALGTGAFAAILGMLLSFRNKPIWEVNVETRVGEIQITAIIAALAQVAQSALLVPISYCIGQLKWKWFQKSRCVVDLDRFDLASRGPDGSVRLLWHLSWRQRLVSLGALATILMLLFPTFVQQSVQESSVIVVEQDTDKAMIARAVNVPDRTTGNVKLYTLTSNGTASSYEVNIALNDALRNGATNPDPLNYFNMRSISRYARMSAMLGGVCWSNSGECSWPAFRTLAVCSSGQNVTREIVLKDNRVSLPALQRATSDQDPPSFQSGLNGYTYTASSNGSGLAPLHASSVSDGTNLPNLAEVYYLFYDHCGDSQTIQKSTATRWKAFKGTFQICLQTLNATTKETRATNYEKDMTTLTIVNKTSNLFWNERNEGNKTTLCTKVDGDDTDYCISKSFMQRLSAHMSMAFDFTADFTNPALSDMQYSSEWGPLLSRPVYETCSDRPWSRLDYFGDLLEGIAVSLTDEFRAYANRSDAVNGTYAHSETVVLVDFRWLILPGALWVIIAIFFVSTIATTSSTPMWKSSPLPLIDLANSEATHASADEIRENAKKTRMKLGRTQNGWQLLDATESSGMGAEENPKERAVDPS